MLINLDNWQKEILKHQGNIILCTGRRVGKTEIFAQKGGDEMIKRRCSIVIVSLTEDQAMIINAMMLNYLKQTAPHLISKKRADTNTRSIKLKNGSQCIIRPVGQTGDSIRGFNADILIIDEAARMPELFWIAALPILLTNAGQLWIASTPHGKKGYFWERFNEAYNLKKEDSRFKAFYITTEQVMKERPISSSWTQTQRDAALQMLEEAKKEMTTMQYQQEYMGMFIDDILQFFPDTLINKYSPIDKDLIPKGDDYLGVDIARYGGDRCAYEVIRRVDINEKTSKFYHILNITKQFQPLTTTEDDIRPIAMRCVKTGLDAGSGSLGVMILDRFMIDPHLKGKVIKMNNREIVTDKDGSAQRMFKEDMYNNLKNMMERDEILIDMTDDVKQCFKSIQFEIDERTGNFRIYAYPSADIVEGIVRAAWLARKEKINKVVLRYI